MANINAINNRSYTLTVDNALTVSAGGAAVTGNSTINGGTVGIGSDAADNTLSIGTSASAGRIINLGNTTGTSGLVAKVGTGNFSLDGITGSTYAIGASTTTGTITLGGSGMTGNLTLGNSTSGQTVNILNTAAANTLNLMGSGATTASTINIGTGAAAHAVNLGSSNTTARTVIRSGSGNIALNTGFTVDSTGRNSNSKQSAFFVYLSANSTNATGDGTNFKIPFNTKAFDQNNDFNTTTNTFTAPITGIYVLGGNLSISNIGAQTSMQWFINGAGTSAFTQNLFFDTFGIAVAGGQVWTGTMIMKMTAGDTATLQLIGSGSTKTLTVTGTLGNSSFYGYQLC